VTPDLETGLISAASVAAAVRPDTCLVSIIHAQNETGAINDAAAIAAAVRAKNPETFIHFDCTQSFAKRRLTIQSLGNPDIVSASVHKFHGLKGCGIMYASPAIRQKIKFASLIKGTQFGGLRGGTENVMAIASIIPALKYTFREGETERVGILTQHLWRKMREMCDRHQFQFRVHGPPQNRPDRRLPNTLFVTCPGAKLCSFGMVKFFADRGIDIGAGSACRQNEHEKPLKNMPDHSVRISLGHEATMADCDQFLAAFTEFLANQTQ
jgi:cysteine desulfurase